jgi:dihydroorotase
MNLVIRGGRNLDVRTNEFEIRDVFVIDGRLASAEGALGVNSFDIEIDARGKWIFPGLIDLCARFGGVIDQNLELAQREFAAMSSGGITDVVISPDKKLFLDDSSEVEMLLHRSDRFASTRVHINGAMTKSLGVDLLSEMQELKRSGCFGVSLGQAPVPDPKTLLSLMQYAKTMDLPIFISPRDKSFYDDEVMFSGERAIRLGLPSVPNFVEAIAVSTILYCAENSGVRVHFSEISTALAVDLIRQAKSKGMSVTCDTTINHLHLSDADMEDFECRYKLRPPLASPKDRLSIREGLREGTIDAISSGHSPTSDDDKNLPFGEAAFGASGFELLLALVIKWATEDEVSIPFALSKVTTGPAKILSMPSVSTSEEGAPANLCIFDPDHHWTVDCSNLKSSSKWTPFSGETIRGRVHQVISDGKLIYSENN